MSKLCPLLSIVNAISKTGLEPEQCRRRGCAWWVDLGCIEGLPVGRCAINQLAEASEALVEIARLIR